MWTGMVISTTPLWMYLHTFRPTWIFTWSSLSRPVTRESQRKELAVHCDITIVICHSKLKQAWHVNRHRQIYTDLNHPLHIHIPDDINGSCTDFGIFTHDADACCEGTINAEHHCLCFGWQNCQEKVHRSVVTPAERKRPSKIILDEKWWKECRCPSS